MNRWSTLVLLTIILMLALTRPYRSWRTLERYWVQRNWILTVLVTVLLLYLLYGLITFYRQGGLAAY